MDGWEITRNIAILILVIQGLVLFLALFIGGVIGSIAIIETTDRIRRGLRQLARSTERMRDTVDATVRTRVLEPVTEVERARARLDAYVSHLQQALRDAGNSADRPTEA